MITNSWSRLRLTMITAALLLGIGWRAHWRQSATLGYDHGHRNRDHGGHPLSMTMRMSFWRCCRLDIVVTTSLKCSRQPSSVVRILGRRHRRRWQTTWTTSVVGRPTLSSFAVCRHSRNPSYCMRPRDYDVHMSRRVCLGPLSVPASGYGYSSMTSVPAILLRLSRRDCPGLLSPPPCPMVWK